MLTLAVLKLAFVDHSLPAMFSLLIAILFLAMVELGWFDGGGL